MSIEEQEERIAILKGEYEALNKQMQLKQKEAELKKRIAALKADNDPILKVLKVGGTFLKRVGDNINKQSARRKKHGRVYC